jgi:hypothetical protein
VTQQSYEVRYTQTFLYRNTAASTDPSAYIERPQTLCWISSETLTGENRIISKPECKAWHFRRMTITCHPEKSDGTNGMHAHQCVLQGHPPYKAAAQDP